jgi:aryl-alcohol dehydrogenase-like predicted oxidoreductase
VVEVAGRLGKTPAQVAIAWLLSKPEITSPVVGVSRAEQLEQLVDAASIELDDSDVTYLEELYRPLENLLSFGIS